MSMRPSISQALTALTLVGLALVISAALLYPITILLGPSAAVEHSIEAKAHEQSIMLVASTASPHKTRPVSSQNTQQKSVPLALQQAQEPTKIPIQSQKSLKKHSQLNNINIKKESIKPIAPAVLSDNMAILKTMPQAEQAVTAAERVTKSEQKLKLDDKPVANEQISSQKSTAEPRSRTLLTKLEPKYPNKARRRGIEGRVLLQFMISASGKVSEIEVLAATPAGYFEKAAIEAITMWQYAAVTAGNNTESRQQIAMEFKLH